MTDSPKTTLTEHPYRRLVVAETHARPVPAMVAPCRVRRLGFMSGCDGRELNALHAKMATLVASTTDGPDWARQIAFERDDRQVTWERHNEFVTLTWTAAKTDAVTRPVGIGIEFHADLLLVFATRIDLVPTDAIEPQALAGFDPLCLCHTSIFDDAAEAATDFHLDAEGFTRIEVATRTMGPLRQGVLVRRLLEIETYRSMALIGLPLARELSGKVTDYEQRLARVAPAVGQDETVEDHQQTLAGLHKLSGEIGSTVEETSFRFAATKAYGEVLAERLARLRERALGEFTSIERFINNRAQPALATCMATEKRLDRLTEKVQRAIELLNARIALSIQGQNQSVLDSIAETGRSQFRLQQTVEGLSIIAITYYALGILSHIADAVPAVGPVSKDVVLALSAPIVFILALIGVQRLRHRIRR